MYIICYYSEELKRDIWERVSGEDVMQNRVSDLCDSGLKSNEILVFNETDELDSKAAQSENAKTDDEIKHICEILDHSLALAGYKSMDGGPDWVIIRNSHKNSDYEIKITGLF